MFYVKEWGASCPEFVAAYRLEHDMSWTQVSVNIRDCQLIILISCRVIFLQLFDKGAVFL